MATIALFGLDIGKHSFHLVGQDANGKPVFKRQFTRSSLIHYLAQHPACRIVDVGLLWRTLASPSTRWFRPSGAIDRTTVCSPFVTGNKNDFLDAHAICEAASRPSMRYVGVKTPEQQASSALHRLREARIADRVQTANQIHALLLEFGIVLPLGARGIKQVPDIVMNASADLPHAARRILSAQYEHYRYLAELIAGLDSQIGAQAKADALTSRLMPFPA